MVMRDLVVSLQTYINEFAGSKTMRYVIEPLKTKLTEYEGEQYPKQFVDLVQTFIAVITRDSKYASVKVGSDYYPVSDFQFPERWWELARGMKVYSSVAAYGNANPVHQIEGEEVATLDPKRVEQFFMRFNGTQQESELKVKLSAAPDWFGQVVTTLDFKALMLDESLAANNPSGAIDEIVAQVCEVDSPYESDESYCYPCVDEERVMRWLMSVE